MRQDNFSPAQQMQGAIIVSQLLLTLRHILWAVVLISVGIPATVEIFRIMANA